MRPHVHTWRSRHLTLVVCRAGAILWHLVQKYDPGRQLWPEARNRNHCFALQRSIVEAESQPALAVTAR